MSPAASENNPAAIPPNILGVFAYLDQVLPAVTRDRHATEDISIGRGFRGDATHDLRERGRDLIRRSFPLKDDSAPLCQDLETFRLYHSSDKADALIVAYGLRTRGLDPLPALTADYAIRSGGILRWADIEEIRAEARAEPRHPYRSLHSHMREGDRIAHYSLPTSLGLMLVRGDRLVCTIATLHMSIEGDAGPGWTKQMAEWEAGGGYKGFFARTRHAIPTPRTR